MPDVGKIIVTVTTPKDKLDEVKGLITANLTSLKATGKVLYADWSAEPKFEPESGTV